MIGCRDSDFIIGSHPARRVEVSSSGVVLGSGNIEGVLGTKIPWPVNTGSTFPAPPSRLGDSDPSLSRFGWQLRLPISYLVGCTAVS